MRQYDSYKDSGVRWIGRMPSHWKQVPIKFTVKNSANSFIDGDWIESNVITSDGIRYLTTGNVGVLEYKEQGSGFISEKTFVDLDCTEVFPGDLLISRLNLPIGRTCIVPDLGYRIVVAVDNVIYRPDQSLYDKRFLMYQMNCYPYSEYTALVARGTTMQRISRNLLGSIKIIVPPLSEQQAIAEYLDERTSRIDSVIAKRERQIELLEEMKTAIISRVVTRGLNPDAPLKDSGIEWIGKIPEHWEIVNLKRYLKEKMMYGANEPAQSDNTDWPRYIRITDIDNNGNLKEETFKSLHPNKAKDYILEKGDILFARSGATVGKTFLYNLNEPACFAGYLIKAKCNSSVLSPIFVLYYTNSGCYNNWKNSIFIQSTIQNISADKYSMMPIPIPPLSEQKAIVAYLDAECAKIDKRIEMVSKGIDLLKELKQTLISDIVTGKMKVC